MSGAWWSQGATGLLARRLAQETHGVMSQAWRAVAGRGSALGSQIPDAPQLRVIRHQAATGLADNILPFWTAHAVDQEHGGFLNELDRFGRPLGSGDKYLVYHARLVWTLAAAHRYGLVDRGYLKLADRGARFLVDRMWDREAGGFIRAVRRDGTPADRNRRTYGQAFAIFGLAEYALAAQNPWARDWAVRTWDVLCADAGDGELGFYEDLQADQRTGPRQGKIFKSLNDHLHVMEALTTLAEATGAPAHAAALRAVTELILERGIASRHQHAIDDPLDRTWRRRVTWRQPFRVSYGHGVELAWLAERALVGVLGESPTPVRARLLPLIDHALDNGFDRRRGGLALAGPPRGHARLGWYHPAEWRIKRWWEQAELLVATLEAYRWTGAPRYLEAFVRQFDWVWTHQTDHMVGDWFEAVPWRGGAPLNLTKAHEWKDPYHNARALMEVARGLAAILGENGGPSLPPAGAPADPWPVKPSGLA
jgi:mannobiose 2-epimerase